MARNRVQNGAPGINSGDYDMGKAYTEAEKIVNTPGDWQQGVAWGRPYDWGNPTFTWNDIKQKIPDFYNALKQGNVGTADNQVLYLNPGGDFFIVTRGQNYTLCKNRSCVQP